MLTEIDFVRSPQLVIREQDGRDCAQRPVHVFVASRRCYAGLRSGRAGEWARLFKVAVRAAESAWAAMGRWRC